MEQMDAFMYFLNVWHVLFLKTKQNTNTVDIRPVAIRISQHGLSTAQNFSNT